MSQKSRFNLIAVPQHVIQRGNNREPGFFSEDDYRRYLEDLKVATKKYGCRVHANVSMTNHVHLLIIPMMDSSIPQFMQALGRCYVKYINHIYKRTGTLWEGRYKSSLVDSDHYLLSCMRYIELNPIRACLVDHPGEYAWSSYGVNAQGKKDGLIEHHPLYLELESEADARQARYRELFRHHMDEDMLHEIRDSLNRELVLGRSYFKDRIEQITKRQTRLGKPGRPRIERKTLSIMCIISILENFAL